MTIEEMLRQGMSTDEVMKKVQEQITDVNSKLKAEAEAKAKAEAEAKTKADTDARTKTLVDICNHAMTNNLTAEDVAYLERLYAMQKYPEQTQMLSHILTAEEIDNTISIAMTTLNTFQPLLDIFGIKDWNEVLAGLSPEQIAESQKKIKNERRTDAQILHDFIKKNL